MLCELRETRRSLRENGAEKRKRRQRKSKEYMVLMHNNISSDIFRADTEEMLRIARRQQVEQKEHFLAVQAQRDRTEFERVLK